MRRTNWKTVSTLVTMVVIAGCQDNLVSAPQASSSAPVAMMMAPEGAPRLSLLSSASSNADVDFTVSPNGGIYFIGKHAVVFPARSICDPAKSSYGPDTWDTPCTAISQPLKIHATVRTAKAGTWIDFSPALRFVPSTNASKWVWLYMNAPQVVAANEFSQYSILYTPGIGGVTVDDAKSDASLRTYIDTRSGQSARRIKHFSGYAMSSGRACDPNVEVDCYPIQDGGRP
jgi:hypothetical protein